VPDACLADILSDLSDLKEHTEDKLSADKVVKIYEYLWHNYSDKDNPDLTRMRSVTFIVLGQRLTALLVTLSKSHH
jgi:hypothetical protein